MLFIQFLFDSVLRIFVSYLRDLISSLSLTGGCNLVRFAGRDRVGWGTQRMKCTGSAFSGLPRLSWVCLIWKLDLQ